MKKFIRNLTNKTSGMVAGVFTGFAAGFLPGYHRFIAPHPFVGFVPYLTTLPYFLLTSIVKGVYEGAKNGFAAACVYPRVLNEQLIRKRQHNEIVQTLQQMPSPSSIWLKEEEILALNNALAQQDSAKKNKLAEQYARYQSFAAINCPLTGKPLKELSEPVIVRLATEQIYFCEKSALIKLADECLKLGVPLSLNKKRNPQASEIIHTQNLIPFKISLFHAINNFLSKAKELISSVRYVNTVLGTAEKPKENLVPPVIAAESKRDEASPEVILPRPTYGNWVKLDRKGEESLKERTSIALSAHRFLAQQKNEVSKDQEASQATKLPTAYVRWVEARRKM